MSLQIKLRVIAAGYSRSLQSSAKSPEGLKTLLAKTLLELKPSEWLLGETEGDFPWEFISLLNDLPRSSRDFYEAANDLAQALGDSTLTDSGFPIFDFEFSRLAFRHASFPNASSVGILGSASETPVLICESDFDTTFGLVPVREIASYEYFQDSTGAPVSWSGGGRLIQVNKQSALSFGTGDSASQPEVLDWTLEGELDSQHAKAIVSWLDEQNLVTPLAWLTTPVGSGHSKANRQILSEIAHGESSGLSLEFNLTQREMALVVEYCPRHSDLFVPLIDMFNSNKNALLRDLFIYFGLSGLLFDGGRRLEESYLDFDAARRVIKRFYLLLKSRDEDLPSLAKTKAVISRLENVAFCSSIEEKIQALRTSDDHGLRIAGTLIAQEKDSLAQEELIRELIHAFNDWDRWLELEKYLDVLKECFQNEQDSWDE